MSDERIKVIKEGPIKFQIVRFKTFGTIYGTDYVEMEYEDFSGAEGTLGVDYFNYLHKFKDELQTDQLIILMTLYGSVSPIIPEEQSND